MTYGANPNDNVDDQPAFQACYEAARAVSGKIIIPSPGSGYWRFNSTWNIVPDASNQVWVDLEMMGGRAGTIKYFGPNNTAAIKDRTERCNMDGLKYIN